ncbi:uncharacterized protein LOC34617739 [Cyclospora cayetanensis]|nr:uncharacterized protein LOC34617739 [Cyclospora cayetanensis]
MPAYLLRLARPSLLQRSCSREAVARLTTAAAAATPQAPGGSPPVAPPAAQGGSIPLSPQKQSSACIPPAFTSFEAMLNACGGSEDTVYKRLIERSIAAYGAERESVDKHLMPILQKNKLVLFLEGTVDNPKSMLSMNVVKMLTQLQSVPLVAVDVTTHAAILGFALTHGKKSRCPLLFLDGVCLGSHDTLLQLYQSGTLAKQIAGKLPPTSQYFEGELPIALY